MALAVSTRELTHDLVLRIKQTTNIPPVPHLTCVGHTKSEIDAILTRYAEAGVSNILALRGDPPKDQPNYDWSQGDFRYAADLVAHIKNSMTRATTQTREALALA